MQIRLFLSAEHDCSYLPEKRSRLASIPGDLQLNSGIYALLLGNGFRRSGDAVYRPHCNGCTACVPVRILVAAFVPNRSQRRIGKLNADLNAVIRPAEFDEEHYQLFARYLSARHPGGDMEQGNRDDYIRFLGNSGWLDTMFCEFRDAHGSLLAVSVIDVTPDALSAVYTYYAPECERRSLGTYAILWQIAEAQRRGLSWVYLGFWIEECRKMSYKRAFHPLECLTADGWRVREDAE